MPLGLEPVLSIPARRVGFNGKDNRSWILPFEDFMKASCRGDLPEDFIVMT